MVQLAHQSLVLALRIKGGAQSRIVERTGELFHLHVRRLLVDPRDHTLDEFDRGATLSRPPDVFGVV